VLVLAAGKLAEIVASVAALVCQLAHHRCRCFRAGGEAKEIASFIAVRDPGSKVRASRDHLARPLNSAARTKGN